MNNWKVCSCFLAAIVLLCSCANQDEIEIDPGLTRYVDPFIGTADHGHVYPGATVPFGAVQLSPDNGTQGWDWCSGYNYIDSTIVGFSHTHLSGTGIGDLCDILTMPVNVPVNLTMAVDDVRNAPYATTFSHDQEDASPGYYRVILDNGIEVELTASRHVGMQRYHFPQGGLTQVVMDLGYAINWDRPTKTRIGEDEATIFTGERLSTGWAKDQRVYFACAFSQAPASMQLYDSTSIQSGNSAEGRRIRALWQWPDGTEELLVKVGISSANEAGALAALEEIPGWDFNDMHRKAITTWNEHLGKIVVESDHDSLLRTFYTALYRTALAPVVYGDIQGAYKAPGGAIKTAQGYTRYDLWSLWDTFRAANPLFTITHPDRINDFVRSILDHYDEYGLLPVWSLLGNETNTMTGYHAVPVLVDAYMKGHRDYDADKMYAALKASAMQNIRGTDEYREYGYIPYEMDGQSVTKTLEYAYDDWCIAQMAFLLGHEQDYDYFMERSRSYQQLFDASTGFMRAKLASGAWKTPFDPTYSDHNFEVAEYTEGNAWQHSWFVPHDVRDLIELHGGPQAFVDKLDSLFSIDSEIAGENASDDISGLIGQYAHGNEPSHHIPYLYNYAGAPWKTQERVREIMTTQYNDTPHGLCGNEDCGQMSAWYVFSAMGFYPVNPAQGIYVIGTPMFNKVTIDVGEGKTFVLRARYLTAENKYVQAATLQEAPLTRSYLHHFEIMEGGEMILELGPQPNYLHWVDPQALPPSASDPEME